MRIRIALLVLASWVTAILAEENNIRHSTMKPFAPGDIFVGATLLNNPDDDHAGIGRIIQFDANLRFLGNRGV